MRYLFLAGLASAMQNLDDNKCEPHRSCWTGTVLKYPGTTPTCFEDADCSEGHYCLAHMWTYNDQTESGTGCWVTEVCAGNGTYTMMGEIIQQYFCSEDQHAANQGKSPPDDWQLVPRPEKHWDTFEDACETDADCPRPDLGQVCTEIYWFSTEDELNWVNGMSCYNYEAAVCPGKAFASKNYNYENTNFSFYLQQRCTSGESGAAVLITGTATFLAALSVF